MTTVLFTQERSTYLKLNCDCWDIHRNALNYTGTDAVIAHPPCRAWSRMRGLARPLPGEKELALFAIDVVRRNGGVLEHPSSSTLYPQFLPLPGGTDPHGGYSICIDQFWFGHLAQKPTLLYIVGIPERKLPSIPLKLDCITHVVGHSTAAHKTGKKEISKNKRSWTPPAMAQWLIDTVTLIEQRKTLKNEPSKTTLTSTGIYSRSND